MLSNAGVDMQPPIGLRVDDAHGVCETWPGSPASHYDKRCVLHKELPLLSDVDSVLDALVDVLGPDAIRLI